MVFIPDEPEQDELTNADLAGAETWFQAFYSQDPLLMAALKTGVKIHRVRGCVIYRGWDKDTLPPKSLLDSIRLVCDDCAAIGVKECSHSEYALSKQGGHALAYREGAERFCKEQRKKGIFIKESQANEIRKKIISKYIHDWHVSTETDLRRTPWIETPLGRKRGCSGQFDDRLINQVLSWKCQAPVGQITNRAMIKLDQDFTRLRLPARIITQTHDSLTVCNRISIRHEVDELMHAAFHQPITIHGRTFVIPIEITRGPNWRDLK
jgi:DNA polymerase I-like protein with 3'-5' exonuclease and polymerase domains